MKLEYITLSRIPTEKAHGVQVMHMCESFSNAGIDVTLLLPRRFNVFKEDPFDYYGVKRNFTIKKLFMIDLFPIERWVGRLAYWVSIVSFHERLFFRFIFGRRDRVIYTRDALMSTLTFLGYKVYYECHAIPDRRRKSFFRFAKMATGVVTITNNLKKKFLEQGFTDDGVFVAHDGVALERFEKSIPRRDTLRSELALNSDKKVIGYIGKARTMGVTKGIEYIIDAFARIQHTEKQAILMLVGMEDAEIPRLHELCKQKDIVPDRYRIIGHVPPFDVAGYMYTADVLVLYYPDTTFYRYYTSPLKLFEYMASKRTIVGCNLPSIAEILDDTNAVLVTPDDPEALSAGMQKALTDITRAQQAYEKVKEYTWDARGEDIKKFIA